MPATLRDRVLFTLKFFDLQNTPLTILQLQDFLLNDPEFLKNKINSEFEIKDTANPIENVVEQEIQKTLNELGDAIESQQGYYCLAGRRNIIVDQQANQVFRQYREKLIQRFVPKLRFIPFVRGAAVGGSHTLGQSKENSDIDLFIVLDPKFLWLGRFLVTGYFQLIGFRRHGEKVANRFCLNHYLGGAIEVDKERDLFNAMEYLRLRPMVYPQTIREFLLKNESWLRNFFPQGKIVEVKDQAQSSFQVILESIFRNGFGRWLNMRLGKYQMKRIMRGKPAVANPIELSFHDKARKFELLARLFRP